MAQLPETIDRLVSAINGGDTPALMALLAPGAVVDDWGSVYNTPAKIAAWNKRELIGAKGTLTVTSMRKRGDTVELGTDWKSNFFSGTGTFRLTLEGSKIKRWEISA